MWNDWVEKAKDLASNIDQQLNEAVGADADPNNPSSATATAVGGGTSTTNSLLNTGTSGTVEASDANGDDDAWNDDFDFGDDDDDGGDDKEDSTPAPKTPETEVKPVPPTIPTSSGGDAAAAASTNDRVGVVVVDDDDDDAAAVPEASSGTGPESSPSAEPLVDNDAVKPPTTSAVVEEPEPVETPAEAGWDDDNDDLEFSNNNDDGGFDAVEKNETHSEMVSASDDNATASKDDGGDTVLASASNEENEEEPTKDAAMPTSFTEASSQPELATEIEEPNQVDVEIISPNDNSTPVADDEAKNDDTNSPKIEERPSLFSNLAHRAEGLAHRAEGIAHKAEGGVSSLIAAASHLGDNITHGERDDVDDKTVESSPKSKVAGKVSSIFASALSGATSAVVSAATSEDKDLDHGDDDNKDKSVEDKASPQDGGWDGDDDDLDITETEGGDDAVVTSQATKIDESKDSDQADSPHKTEEDLMQSTTTANVPQSEHQSTAEETTSYVSVSGPESVLVESTETSPLSSDNEKHDRGVIVPGEQANAIESANVPIAANNIENDPRYLELQERLRLREDQLASKAEQLNELQSLMESQEADFRKKLTETKEEAKKRIQRAKERCEAAEAKLLLKSSSGAEDSAKQEGIIKALREEGQALAMKQAAMEQAVRAAKAESRQMAEQLDDEASQKEQALEKISKLEMELKITKDSLNAARKGESQAGKLENDLLAARSDAETKANTILSLQQQIKELSTESKDLRNEIQSTRKAAAHEAQQEKSTLRREHNDLIADLETKLRTTEREAGVREDALRHEVAELRKRWQDAVRRADALSMDIQSSTAPLLRQLESMERQNRARAANWAELEGRLRNELEESVIQNENLSKDRLEFKSKISRLERIAKERDDELMTSRKTIEDQNTKIERLEAQLSKLESEALKRQEEYEKVERLANEGVARVRSEMTQTVVESEERYRGQIEKLEGELKIEKEKRSQLESQVDQLLENAGGMLGTPQHVPQAIRQESKPKKLRQSEGQAEILAGALGFVDSDDESVEDGDDELDQDMHNGVTEDGGNERRGSSFAALEQLTSRLKTAEVELKALRKSLRDSELTRESLVEELADTRHAKEKLPLFEAKVRELTEDNREKELEILGLQDDVLEVKELYRTQLNILLEEKASENVQTTDRRHSSPANVVDPAATTASNGAASTSLSTVNEPVAA